MYSNYCLSTMDTESKVFMKQKLVFQFCYMQFRMHLKLQNLLLTLSTISDVQAIYNIPEPVVSRLIIAISICFILILTKRKYILPTITSFK